MRKVLSLTELIDDYNIMSNRNSNDLVSLSKRERRIIWKKQCSERYPDLKPCPFCGSTVNDGLSFEAAYNSDAIWHSRLSKITCDNCNLEFKGDFGWHSGQACVEQWNALRYSR